MVALLICRVGVFIILTVVIALPMQLFTSVPVTVYEIEFDGFETTVAPMLLFNAVVGIQV